MNLPLSPSFPPLPVLYTQGKSLVHTGSVLEESGDLQGAFSSYSAGLDHLLHVLRLDQNMDDKERTALRTFCRVWMGHAEKVKERMEEKEGKRKERITFANVIGLERVKQLLWENISLPLLRPDLFDSQLRTTIRGLLLFGPPGSGKSFLAKATAGSSNCNFYPVSASTIMGQYVGESENMVKKLFDTARQNQPAIIFIDEVDSLLSKRSANDNEVSRRVKTEFLLQWDGIASSANDRLLVIGATNLPGDLDDAALRRFEKRVLLPLPDKENRRMLINHLLNPYKVNASKLDIEQIVNQTEYYSAAEITSLCKEAAMGPIRDINPAKLLHIESKELAPIRMDHFFSALKSIRPALSIEQLSYYKQWNEEFGSALPALN